MLEKIVKHDVGVNIFSKFNYNSHTFTVCLVAKICDTVEFFIFYELGYLFDKSCLVYHVRKFGNYDSVLSVRKSFDIRYGANSDFAAACSVSVLDSPCS